MHFTTRLGKRNIISSGWEDRGGDDMWYSLDPVIAMRAIRDMDESQLRQVVCQARCAEVRRAAVLRIGDPDLLRHYALCDPAPLVRRRLVRELSDLEVLKQIAEYDTAADVREAAFQRMKILEESKYQCEKGGNSREKAISLDHLPNL